MADKAPAPAHLSDAAKAAWADLITGGESPAELAALEAAAVQLARARDASARIDREGIVVAGTRGAPMPHPALDVERAAHKAVQAWANEKVKRQGSADASWGL
jgi:phage terminase small subunit